MKLELKHIVPYLPYGLQAVLTQDHREDFSGEDYYDENIFIEGAIWEVSGYADGKLHIPCGEGDLDGFIYNSGYTYACFDYGIKPILRPMSDLHTEIEHNDKILIPANWLYKEFDVTGLMFNGYCDDPKYGYEVYLKLFEWHFDVFGLIPAALAIDINSLDQK